MYRLMIVEDDRGIAEAIKKASQSWGFESFAVSDFTAVMDEFRRFEPHMVLLDISLPFYSGYHWCSEIRKVSNVPVIFISSASDDMNIIMAMNMGGDDFIAKPFDLSVLIAKVMALLRRCYDLAPAQIVLSHKGATLDTSANVLCFDGKRIELTKNEYRILLCLMENVGKVISREKLMERLWETDCFVDDNTLTVNVNRLRKKLDASGLENFIATKFGVGYIIE